MNRLISLAVPMMILTGCITLKDNGKGKYRLGVTTETTKEADTPKAEPGNTVAETGQSSSAHVVEPVKTEAVVQNTAIAEPATQKSFVPPPAPEIKIEKQMADEYDVKSVKVIIAWQDALTLVLNVEQETTPPTTLVAYANGSDTTLPVFSEVDDGSCERVAADAFMIAPGLLAVQFTCISSGDNHYEDTYVVIYEFHAKPTSYSMIRERWTGKGTTLASGEYADSDIGVTFRLDGNKVIADRVNRNGHNTGEAEREATEDGGEFVPEADDLTNSSEVLFERSF
jgi:hypothetical protein